MDLFSFLENHIVPAFLVMGLRWILQLLGCDAISATCDLHVSIIRWYRVLSAQILHLPGILIS
jgi:hypothetical protein